MHPPPCTQHILFKLLYEQFSLPASSSSSLSLNAFAISGSAALVLSLLALLCDLIVRHATGYELAHSEEQGQRMCIYDVLLACVKSKEAELQVAGVKLVNAMLLACRDKDLLDAFNNRLRNTKGFYECISALVSAGVYVRIYSNKHAFK